MSNVNLYSAFSQKTSNALVFVGDV